MRNNFLMPKLFPVVAAILDFRLTKKTKKQKKITRKKQYTFDEENLYQVTITHGFREEYFNFQPIKKHNAIS